MVQRTLVNMKMSARNWSTDIARTALTAVSTARHENALRSCQRRPARAVRDQCPALDDGVVTRQVALVLEYSIQMPGMLSLVTRLYSTRMGLHWCAVACGAPQLGFQPFPSPRRFRRSDARGRRSGCVQPGKGTGASRVSRPAIHRSVVVRRRADMSILDRRWRARQVGGVALQLRTGTLRPGRIRHTRRPSSCTWLRVNGRKSVAGGRGWRRTHSSKLALTEGLSPPFTNVTSRASAYVAIESTLST